MEPYDKPMKNICSFGASGGSSSRLASSGRPHTTKAPYALMLEMGIEGKALVDHTEIATYLIEQHNAVPQNGHFIMTPDAADAAARHMANHYGEFARLERRRA